MSFSIRDVHLGDAEAVIAILNPIIEARAYTVLDAPFTIAEERDFIDRFPARGVWKIAERQSDGRVVGFQTLEPFGPYTRAFDHVASIGTFVALDQKRRGIATALFSASFRAARDKGFEKLFTFVRADNPGALAVYAKHGFTAVGTASRQAKIDGRYIDEIFIERTLE